MSLFQLYEANKDKYKHLKPGSIWRCKGLRNYTMKIIAINREDKKSAVICMTNPFNTTPDQIVYSIENSYILDKYEPCEDSLE